MPDYKLEVHHRYLDRQFESAIGKSLAKAIAEPITNSDDSYKRLAENPSVIEVNHEKKPITIKYFRAEKRFQIIDHAEGLIDDEMLNNFGRYGEDTSGQSLGLPVRGLFGKGLADVMFTQQKSNVKSIKGDNSYVCKFLRKEGAHYLSITTGPRVNKQLRQVWGMTEGNGTLVEFILRDGVPLPQHDKLIEKLSNFYMLRMINSDPRRIVKLVSYDRQHNPRSNLLRYEFPTGEVLLENTFEFTYEHYPSIKVELTVKRHEAPLIQTGYEEREGGLLIVDGNNTVYDLTLFKFNSDPYADNFFGLVRLTGAREVIWDKLNNYNEEVLTDTRDGFNIKHSFYTTIASMIEPLLEPLIENERRLRKSTKEELAPEVKLKHMRAFQKLNELYKQITEQTEVIGINPMLRDTIPKDGLEFARSDITTTIGKKYSMLLRIDTQAIVPGSTIAIHSNNNHIDVEPSIIIVEEPKTGERVDCKSVSIKGDLASEIGVVSAQVNDHQADVLVTVVSEEIFIPIYGLDFHPDVFYAHQGKRSFLNLYADLSKVDLHDTIELATDNIAVQLESTTYNLTESTVYDDRVARLKVPVTGYGVGEKAFIYATCGSIEALASISIISGRQQPPPGRQGIFSGYRFDRLAKRYQTWYDSVTGEIIINTEHPINKLYFGEEPSQAVQTLPHCQIVLAELILSECLNFMVSQAYYDGLLERLECTPLELDIGIRYNWATGKG